MRWPIFGVTLNMLLFFFASSMRRRRRRRRSKMEEYEIFDDKIDDEKERMNLMEEDAIEDDTLA